MNLSATVNQSVKSRGYAILRRMFLSLAMLFVVGGAPPDVGAVPSCGNAVVDGDEDCDDCGVCAGGAVEGAFCNGPAQCGSGECRAVGGDGCAANCTHERGLTALLEPGVIEGQGLEAGMSGAVVYSNFLTTVPMPFWTARLTLRVGRARGSNDIPLAVRAEDLQIGPLPVPNVGCVCVSRAWPPRLLAKVWQEQGQ